jgi:hypothetical protein
MRHVSRSLFLFVFACVRQVPSFVLPYVRSARSSSKAPQISTTSLNLVQDLNVVGLVAGQENYGLAVVCVGEALWSFVQVPSLSHAKILVPAAIAALVLVVVSGPMITSGDVASVSTGLWIATAVSVGLGVSYIARLLAPFSPSPKEIAALGLLASLPSIEFPEINFDLDGSVSLPPIQTIDDPIISSVVDYVPPSVEAPPL